MIPLFIPHPPPGASSDVLAAYDREIAKQGRDAMIIVWLHIAVFGGGLLAIAAAALK